MKTSRLRGGWSWRRWRRSCRRRRRCWQLRSRATWGRRGRQRGGQAFGDAFDGYLEHYGQGSQTWWELHTPTWREEPAAALRLLAGYVADPSRAPVAAHARSGAERTAAIARCEAALGDDGDRERFRSLVEGTTDYVFVIEGRAHWQQNCVGALRPACLALGRKLQERGALASAEDIFHLRLGEVGQLAVDPSGALLDTIGRRKADLASWAGLPPPLTLGPPPPPPPAGVPPNPIALMFGGPAEETGDPLLLKGTGASRGLVTGRARVVFSLEEAERLQPGEVLVCPFTAPSLDAGVHHRRGHRDEPGRGALARRHRGAGVRHSLRDRHRKGHGAHPRRGRR